MSVTGKKVLKKNSKVFLYLRCPLTEALNQFQNLHINLEMLLIKIPVTKGNNLGSKATHYKDVHKFWLDCQKIK